MFYSIPYFCLVSFPNGHKATILYNKIPRGIQNFVNLKAVFSAVLMRETSIVKTANPKNVFQCDI